MVPYVALTQYEDLCSKILDLGNVRFAGVLGKNGDLVSGGYKDGKEGLLDSTEAKMSLHYASMKWNMRKNLSHKIGKEKYSMTVYDKVKQFSIPLNDNELMLISTEPEAPHEKMLSDVLNLIENSKK